MSNDALKTSQSPLSHLNTGCDDEWLTPEQFTKLGGDFPTTARGARMRLQRLAQTTPSLEKESSAKRFPLSHQPER